jgi:hypothetical protein
MTRTEREHLWHQHIQDWRASGFSGMAYCKQQSLTYCRFVYWRKKLTDVEPVADNTGASGFARVAPPVHESTTDGLRVSLPGGVSITGLHAGNIELLGSVLRQL